MRSVDAPCAGRLPSFLRLSLRESACTRLKGHKPHQRHRVLEMSWLLSPTKDNQIHEGVGAETARRDPLEIYCPFIATRSGFQAILVIADQEGGRACSSLREESFDRLSLHKHSGSSLNPCRSAFIHCTKYYTSHLFVCQVFILFRQLFICR